MENGAQGGDSAEGGGVSTEGAGTLRKGVGLCRRGWRLCRRGGDSVEGVETPRMGAETLPFPVHAPNGPLNHHHRWD